MREVVIFSDGGYNGASSREHPVAIGAGIVALCEEFRQEWAIPLGTGTSQKAEILAVKTALELLTDRRQLSVLVVCDSQYVVGALTDYTWKLKYNRSLILSTRTLIRSFGGFRIKWVKGHATTKENVRADYLAAIACGKKTCPTITLSLPVEYGVLTTGNYPPAPNPMSTSPPKP